jgi:hypothetical protein
MIEDAVNREIETPVCFFKKLHKIERLELPSGRGTVRIQIDAQDRIEFHETGVWNPNGTGPLHFRNIYRWSFTQEQEIGLEHLRYGFDQPVFLVTFVSGRYGEFVSRTSHLCGMDRYDGRIHLSPSGFTLEWTVVGPAKNEKFERHYS